MKITKIRFFCLGILFAFCYKSLEQDLMGKDNWLAWARNHWIDGSITIPLAILGIVYIIYKWSKDDNDKSNL